MEAGGIWSIYEKTPEIRGNSFEGLNLDGKISKILEISKYLCQTIDGLPLSDLADYVINNLNKMGERNFREHLIEIRGKSVQEIKIWFNYAKTSRELQNRKITLESAIRTLSKAKEIFLRYQSLINRQTGFILSDDLRNETQLLIKSIDKFFESDYNMALAIKEKSQKPYWDIYEGDVG